VGIFDGNSTVNLHAIINSFPIIARREDAGVDVTFDLSAPLPAFDPAKLSLMARHGCRIVRTLPRSVFELAELADTRPKLEPVLALARQLLDRNNRLLAQLADYRPVRIRASRQAFRLAEQFALDVAAASAIGIWLANYEQHEAATLWRDGVWLHAVLARSLSAPSTVDVDDAMLTELTRQFDEGWSFGVACPHRLAEGMGR
jgi:hypothetical protein